MEKVVIYKNKNEEFKCNLDVNGASIKNTFVRLCLEFKSGKNLFFNGIIGEAGTCNIIIPAMRDMDDGEGDLYIEAIADSVYFKLYESPFILKNSVQVNIKEENFLNSLREQHVAKVSISGLQKTTPVNEEPNPVIAEVIKEKITKEIIEEIEEISNPYIPNKHVPRMPKIAKPKHIVKEQAETKKHVSNLPNFEDYISKKK